MSVPQSVQRLSEDSNASQEVRQLLRASELDGPSEADLARFAARMAPLVGVPVADLASASLPRGTAPAEITAGNWGSAATPTGVTKVVSSFALKALVAAGALTLGLGLWWANQGSVPAGEVERSHSDRVVQVSSQRPAPSAVEAATAADDLTAQPLPEVEAGGSAREQNNEATAERKPVATAASKRVLPAAPSARPDELSLIAQAQALRDQPEALLKVLKQHATLYPHGMLAQEREVLAVEALISAGQLEAGKRRAARLEANYPNSAHLPRIRALLDKANRE